MAPALVVVGFHISLPVLPKERRVRQIRRDKAQHLPAVGGVLQHHLSFQWGGGRGGEGGGVRVTHLSVTDEI